MKVKNAKQKDTAQQLYTLNVDDDNDERRHTKTGHSAARAYFAIIRIRFLFFSAFFFA